MSAPDPLLGRVMAGRYRLVERLGAGAFGVVYRAEDLEGGGPFAVKVLRSDAPLTRDQRARFEREAQVLHRLHHPVIVGFVEYGQDGVGPFIVEELVEGVDLRTVLRTGRVFAPALAARLVGEVLGALSAAHAAGLVHRDVKPSNVMLVEDAQGALSVKLLDFGSVRPFLPPRGTGMFRTRAGLSMGTPAYAAPEQRAGEAVGPAADQFATALLWVEMVIGRRAFRRMGEALRAGHLDALPPEISPAARAVVACAIARAPEDRFASADALRQALERAAKADDARAPAAAVLTGPHELVTTIRRVHGEPPPEASPGQPAQPRTRLRRVALWAGGLAAAAALGLTLWPSSPAPVTSGFGAPSDAPPAVVVSAPPTVVPPIVIRDQGVARSAIADEEPDGALGGALARPPRVARRAAVESARRPPDAGPAAAPRRAPAPPPLAGSVRVTGDDASRGTDATPDARRVTAQPPAPEIPPAPNDAGAPDAGRARAPRRAAGKADPETAALDAGLLEAVLPDAGRSTQQIFSEALGRCDCAAARRALDLLEILGAPAARLPRERYRRACLVLGVGCRRAGVGRPP